MRRLTLKSKRLMATRAAGYVYVKFPIHFAKPGGPVEDLGGLKGFMLDRFHDAKFLCELPFGSIP